MADIVTLPPVASPDIPAPQPLTEATLGQLLGALASRPGPVPKYRYPSAGTLYPVQTYVVLRQPLGGLGAGCYYHDPDEHALARLSDARPTAPDGSHPDAMLILVASHAAIQPIYGAQTERFCLLEAGYMTEALTGTGLCLREAGDPARDFGLTAACALERDHVPLVCWAIGEAA